MSEIKLFRNSKLIDLCDELLEISIDKNDVAKRINKKLSDEVYLWQFSEAELDLVIKQLAKRHDYIKLKPELFDSEYKFFRNRSSIAVTKDGQTQTDYDNIIVVNKIAMVFEAKITNWKRIKKVFRPNIYDSKLKPLVNMFSEICYVVCMPKDTFSNHSFNSFDGIALPFYEDMVAYREKVFSTHYSNCIDPSKRPK